MANVHHCRASIVNESALVIEFLSGTITSSDGGQVLARVTSSIIFCHQIATEDWEEQGVEIASQSTEDSGSLAEINPSVSADIASQSIGQRGGSDGGGIYDKPTDQRLSSSAKNPLTLLSRKWTIVSICSGMALKSLCSCHGSLLSCLWALVHSKGQVTIITSILYYRTNLRISFYLG